MSDSSSPAQDRSQLNAVELTDMLRERAAAVSLSENFLRDADLAKACLAVWTGPSSSGGLVGEIRVEAARPSLNSGESLDSLVTEGLFSQSLADHLHQRGAVPRNRSLYTHQAETLRAEAETGPGDSAPAIVVSAGTGAGKTEAFLLPLLNRLSRQPRNGEGVRAIILYPMNALVNDQVERLDGWLSGQRNLTMFHFTSETPEKDKDAQRLGLTHQPHRFVSRRHARGLNDIGKPRDTLSTQPDVLVTNYSMLEYMLCRPQDACFFGPALEVLVLDEAHLYGGTLAGEITLLLRRVLERCGRSPEDVLQLATTATLGGSDTEVAQFASSVFGADPASVRIVRGAPAPWSFPPPDPPPSHHQCDPVAVASAPDVRTLEERGDRLEFTVDPDACLALRSALSSLVSSDTSSRASDILEPAVLLHTLLSRAPVLHQLCERLDEQPQQPLRELASLFGGESDEHVRAVAALLRLAAAARESVDSPPLIPHRLHVLTRMASGVAACLNPACSGLKELKERRVPEFGTLHPAGVAECGDCKSRVSSILRCENCGEWALDITGRDGIQPPQAATETSEQRSLVVAASRHPAPDRVYQLSPEGQPAAEGVPVVWCEDGCPNCGAGANRWKEVRVGDRLGLQIITETAHAGQPVFRGDARAWLPARGRRMIAFSDSRSAAARLGPALSGQHATQLARAVLVRAVADKPDSPAAADDLREDLNTLRRRAEDPGRDAEARRQASARAVDIEQQLAALESGGKVDDWVARALERPEAREFLTEKAASESEWRQAQWDRNATEVADILSNRIRQEIAYRYVTSSSAESVGLVEVRYPGIEQVNVPEMFCGTLPNSEVSERFRAAWPEYIAALCDSLRADGSITLGSPDADSEYDAGGARVGVWTSRHTSDRLTRVRRFVGEDVHNLSRRVWFTRRFLERIGVPSERVTAEAESLLAASFDALHAAAIDLEWLEAREDQEIADGQSVAALRLSVEGLALSRPRSLFRCVRTGLLWPRSVWGLAPHVGCDQLEVVSPAGLDDDPRWGRQRREYAGIDAAGVFRIGLWAEEHSAQLSPDENRRLQNLFRAGGRNVLSSTTTLELGIDIGGLATVVLANVPPGKANYLQRAGRAGRRADGSAAVVTYCRNRPYDTEVFHRFDRFLDKPLPAPRVLLDRERIATRHAHAVLLAEFFRHVNRGDTGAMEAFGRMSHFCGVPLVTAYWKEGERPQPDPPRAVDIMGAFWVTGSSTEPRSLADHFTLFLRSDRTASDPAVTGPLRRVAAGTPVEPWLDDVAAFLRQAAAAFQKIVEEWSAELKQLLEAYETLPRRDPGMGDSRRQANALRQQMRLLGQVTVIESLADRQFLPRYGFPIGLQRLQIKVAEKNEKGDFQQTRSGGIKVRVEDRYRLERPGLLALREYVPGAFVTVGGREVRSRGLLKHWTGMLQDASAGHRRKQARCTEGHITSLVFGSPRPDTCPDPSCNAQVEIFRDILIPRHGFASAVWDPPRRIGTGSQQRTDTEESTDAFSEQEISERSVTPPRPLGTSKFTVRKCEGGELLVVNSGVKRHGYSVCLDCGFADSEQHPPGENSLPSRDFQSHAPLHSPFRSGRREDLKCGRRNFWRHQHLAASETTDLVQIDFSGGSVTQLTTAVHALCIGGAELLGVDPREFGGFVSRGGTGDMVVIFDATPGGTGHCLELADRGNEWLQAASEVMIRDELHHITCGDACQRCLLTFQSQQDFQAGRLNRHECLKLLSGAAVAPGAQETQRSRRRSREERLAAARAKRRP